MTPTPTTLPRLRHLKIDVLLAHILIEPFLPRRLRLAHDTLPPLVETRPVPLVVFPLEFQSLMRELGFPRLPPRATAESPLLRERWSAGGTLPRGTCVGTGIFARKRPHSQRTQQSCLRLLALGQMARRAALTPTPIRRSAGLCPKHETPKERAVATGNVTPGPLAPAENTDVREAHERLTEGRQQADGEDGVLRELVAVAHAVADEGDEPKEHVDDGVDEEDS